jgi:hypothetical protein
MAFASALGQAESVVAIPRGSITAGAGGEPTRADDAPAAASAA